MQTVELVENLLSENQFLSGVYLEGGMLLAPHKGFWVNFISCKDDDIDEKKAAIYDQESLFFTSIGQAIRRRDFSFENSKNTSEFLDIQGTPSKELESI